MATLTIPNSFVAGSRAIAGDVNANFTAIKNFIDTNLVQIDGTVKAGTSAIADDAVTEAKIADALLEKLTPTGSINQYAGATAPTGWLLCDGSEVAIASNTALYNVLTTNGTVFPYGANTNGSGGAGTTHFRVPDLKGRIPVGRDAGQTEFDALGETGGAKTHTLTTDEMPSHSHGASTNTTGSHTHTIDGVGDHYHTVPTRTTTNSSHTHIVGNRAASTPNPNNANDFVYSDNGGAHSHTMQAAGDHSHSVTVNSTGGDSAHNNLQPYITLNYIIKA